MRVVTEFTSPHLLALTNSGSERALKGEVVAAGLGWRPGFQAKGMVAFKAGDGVGEFGREALRERLAFARRVSLFAGKAGTREGAEEVVRGVGGEGMVVHHLGLEKGRLVGMGGGVGEGRLADGAVVGTVIEVGPEDYWTGLHWHGRLLSPDPGGASGVEMPEDAPSRAWLKLEEAVRFFDLRFRAEDVVVELGCAPGGVILALLRRGVSVIGVDPARLAPVVMASAVAEMPGAGVGGTVPWVVHCRKPAALVSKRDLGGRATWFMSDMNQSPAVAITECRRCIGMCPSIRSAVITLKLTDFAEASAQGEWLAAMRAMGFRTVRLQQMAVHHRELALVGLERSEK
jgi:hypothetical protein